MMITMIFFLHIPAFYFAQIVPAVLKICLQLKQAVDKRSIEINKLEKRINDIVDRLYKGFSKSVGVENIREYEEKQLKTSQSMAEERLSLSSQLSKLKYQYVLPSIYLLTILLLYLLVISHYFGIQWNVRAVMSCQICNMEESTIKATEFNFSNFI